MLFEKLLKRYYKKLSNFKITTKRYMFNQFNFENKIIGIVGNRGVGKTTLLLQLIKEKVKDLNKSFYISLDNHYFINNSLYELVEYFYDEEKRRYFFIDEIHKYKNWSQDLKNIYDDFEDIKVVFSGSSSIDIIKTKYDLSRRVIIKKLPGMSFREYLNFKYNLNIEPISFENLIENYQEISYNIVKTDNIINDFNQYINYGYYPIFLENKNNYVDIINNIVDKVISEDISNTENFNTESIIYFQKILYFLATIKPGEINSNSLANNINISNRKQNIEKNTSNKSVENFLRILEDAGLINFVLKKKKGNALIRSHKKIFFENTTMLNCYNENLGFEVEKGLLREVFFVNVIKNIKKNIFYLQEGGDFQVDNINFEIGGKSKKKKQIIGNEEKSFIVKADIEFPQKDIIPLHLFGFLY